MLTSLMTPIMLKEIKVLTSGETGDQRYAKDILVFYCVLREFLSMYTINTPKRMQDTGGSCHAFAYA